MPSLRLDKAVQKASGTSGLNFLDLDQQHYPGELCSSLRVTPPLPPTGVFRGDIDFGEQVNGYRYSRFVIEICVRLVKTSKQSMHSGLPTPIETRDRRRKAAGRSGLRHTRGAKMRWTTWQAASWPYPAGPANLRQGDVQHEPVGIPAHRMPVRPASTAAWRGHLLEPAGSSGQLQGPAARRLGSAAGVGHVQRSSLGLSRIAWRRLIPVAAGVERFAFCWQFLNSPAIPFRSSALHKPRLLSGATCALRVGPVMFPARPAFIFGAHSR